MMQYGNFQIEIWTVWREVKIRTGFCSINLGQEPVLLLKETDYFFADKLN